MRRNIGCGSVLVVLGLWLWLSALHVPLMNFGRDWPLILVVFGAAVIVRRLVRQHRRRKSAAEVISDLERGRIDPEQAISEIRRSR